MGMGGRAASFERRTIVLSGKQVEYGSGDPIRIVFRSDEIQVGCHTVSLSAWRELVKNYDAYLVGKSEQVYQEG